MAVQTRNRDAVAWRTLALAMAAAMALMVAGCSSGDSDNGDSANGQSNGDSMSSESGSDSMSSDDSMDSEDSMSEEDSMASGESASGPVTLGALMPMTGDLQAYGKSSRHGIELAMQEINKAGGVLGSDLQIKVGDTQTKPQAGIDAAKKLVSVSGVSGIVGAMSSGVTVPVAKSVTSKEGVPQISNASTSPVITDLDDNDFMFRTIPSDAFQGKAIAEVASGNGLKKVSVLYVNNAYGEGLARNFKKAFENGGGSVNASVAFEKGNASYRGELSKADTGGAEALVLIGYPQTGTTIMRQSLEGGNFDQFVFSDGLKAPEIIEAIGADALEGSFGTAPQAREGTDAAKHFKSAYEEANGQLPPKPYIDSAYDAVYVLALAAQAAQSTDPKAVRDELRNVANPPGEEVGPGEWSKAMKLLGNGKDIDYVGASGSIDFDDNGDVSGTFAHWVIKNGKIETVKVFEPAM